MDLSIIIPMYNHEEYVEQAIRSMITGVQYEVEIIVINDASTDRSLEKVQKLQEEYKNIKILQNEKNYGCAYSINKGLEIATGKYIGINSSDDFVDKGYYQKLLEVALKENADVVCANIANYNTKSNETTYFKIEEGNIAIESMNATIPTQVDSAILLGHWTASSSSTKIIKKKFYEKYKFIGSKANDIPCIYPILAAADRIIYYPNLYKYYRIVQKSLSRKDDEESYNSVVESIIKAFELLDELNAEKEKEILFFNNCMEYFIYVLGEIKEEDLKIRCVINFYDKLIKYEDNIFEKMKKSLYFKNFLAKNFISEEEYNKIIEKRPCEFIYFRKILEKNKKLQNEMLKVDELNSNLRADKENLQKANEELIKINELIKQEKETVYKENKKIKEENDLINIKMKEVKDLNEQLKEKIKILNNAIQNYENSRSWRLTKPIRVINNKINRKG